MCCVKNIYFQKYVYVVYKNICWYNAFNVYRRELAPDTVSLTGDRAQGDDNKHWAYSIILKYQLFPQRSCDFLYGYLMSPSMFATSMSK